MTFPRKEDIINWIAEHPQLWNDFKNRFELSINDEEELPQGLLKDTLYVVICSALGETFILGVFYNIEEAKDCLKSDYMSTLKMPEKAFEDFIKTPDLYDNEINSFDAEEGRWAYAQIKDTEQYADWKILEV